MVRPSRVARMICHGSGSRAAARRRNTRMTARTPGQYENRTPRSLRTPCGKASGAHRIISAAEQWRSGPLAALPEPAAPNGHGRR